VADYSKLPHLAHDRFLKIARHYRTLAEIERSATDEAASRVINRETGSTASQHQTLLLRMEVTGITT
jgi:hypothetical protein